MVMVYPTGVIGRPVCMKPEWRIVHTPSTPKFKTQELMLHGRADAKLPSHNTYPVYAMPLFLLCCVYDQAPVGNANQAEHSRYRAVYVIIRYSDLHVVLIREPPIFGPGRFYSCSRSLIRRGHVQCHVEERGWVGGFRGGFYSSGITG